MSGDISGEVSGQVSEGTLEVLLLGHSSQGNASPVALYEDLLLGVFHSAMVLFGFGWGGIYTLLQLLAADLFGLLALGKILGVINIVDTVGGALGPWLTGVLFELQKSYVIPFAVITGLLVIAMIAATFLRPEQGTYPSVAPELA